VIKEMTGGIPGKRRMGRITVFLFLTVLSFIVLLPILLTISYSFEGPLEIIRYFDQFQHAQPQEHIRTKWLPIAFNLNQYYNVLIKEQGYLKYLFNSIRYTVIILIGQLLLAPLAAFAFFKFTFRFKNVLFFIYVVVMMLPFQVVMIPNYIALGNMGLLNTAWSLILPGIFSPFAVFLLRQYMMNVPDELLEAARIDGAGNLQIFFHIMLPQVTPGLAAMVVLSFVEIWNMVEQPLLLVRDKKLYPLSLVLCDLEKVSMTEVFAGVVLFMAPVIILYFIFHDDIISGIEYFRINRL